MKIFLINPKPKDPYPVYGPSLGLCYLSSYLKSKGYTNIKGIDLNIDKQEDLRSSLPGQDIVGMYCSSKSLGQVLNLARIAKTSGSVVVVGGPHPSLCPDEVISDRNVDFVVRGEGEITFYQLIYALENNIELKKLKGLTFKKGSNSPDIINNPDREVIRNLDDIPFPDRTIFNMNKYPSVALTVSATRGCPYMCVNCQPALNKLCGRFRFRSVDNVLKEITEDVIGKYGCTSISFVDNELTVIRKWMNEFCNKIIEQNLKFNWNCQGRVNTLDRELMILMKLAGCTNIGIGIESGSERVVNQVLNKGISLEYSKKIIEWGNEIKLGIHLWFMIGIPGETKEEMEKTIDFASSLNASSIGFSIGTPWPETGFFKICKEKGWLLTYDWEEYNEKRHCRIKTDNFTPEDVEKCRQKIFLVFLKKKWEIDKNSFTVANPYYDNFFKSFLKYVLKHLLFQIFSQNRVTDTYTSLKRKYTSLKRRWHRLLSSFLP